MKHKLLTASAALPLSVLLAWGAIHSMVTGLGLPVGDPGQLLLVWALCALAGCILFSLPNGGLLASTGVLAMGFWLWNTRGLELSIRAMITRLSVIYDSAYDWGILEFTGMDWQTASLDVLLAAWGGVIVLGAAAAVVRGRGSIGAVLLALPPLVSTMVVTDTPPDALPLFSMLTAVALILLTASVAHQNPLQGAKLTAIIALPTALVLGSLLLLFPKDAYVNRAGEQLEAITAWWQNSIVSPFKTGSGLGQDFNPTPTASASTRLGSLGPRRVVAYPVMDVTADFDGLLYLRGQDYDKYDGLSWISTADRMETLPKGRNTTYRGTVTVTTRSPMALTYLPSYPNRDYDLIDGRMENTGEQTEFFWSVAKISVLPEHFSTHSANTDHLMPYLDLPQSTMEWADGYVRQVLKDGGLYDTELIRSMNATIAQIIIDHVASSARYSLNPQRMYSTYDDFAQWFLEESDKGYCVHFATAATVLLRAAGVPARYVTGYVVSCEAGQTVTVQSDKAHAWVEYYDEVHQAWLIAEPTPPDFSEDEPEEESVTAPAPETQPLQETEGEDEPDAPIQTTDPTAPTDSNPGKAPVKINWSRLWKVLRWFVLAAVILFAVVLQRLVRIALRRRAILSDANHRALALWHDVERLSAVLKQDPPEDLLALAQKAKFSQHNLTKEELHQFTEWLKEARQKLNQRPIIYRLWCRYVLALW